MINPEQNGQSGFMETVSLSSQGSRIQFGVAISLISIIPMLTLVYAFWPHVALQSIPTSTIWTLGGILSVTVSMGYALLLKYPRTMIRLRRQMEHIARGELPDSINLSQDESDITAIENYFNLIVDGMKERITRIKKQGEQLVVAERQRVMTESLCTACHCLGQPATAIGGYLSLLKRESLSAAADAHLASCIAEADNLREILEELQGITVYHTESYCTVPKQQKDSPKIIHTKSDTVVRRRAERAPLNAAPNIEEAAIAFS
jgi:signal transduction histidine kinase